MERKTSPKPKTDAGQTREERRKAARKANMAKRKAQARKRAAGEDKKE